jgi:hypothetical protein
MKTDGIGDIKCSSIRRDKILFAGLKSCVAIPSRTSFRAENHSTGGARTRPRSTGPPTSVERRGEVPSEAKALGRRCTCRCLT